MGEAPDWTKRPRLRIGITSGNRYRSQVFDGPPDGNSPFMGSVLPYLYSLSLNGKSGNWQSLYNSLVRNLEPQPHIPKPHLFRLVGHEIGGDFVFDPEGSMRSDSIGSDSGAG